MSMEAELKYCVNTLLVLISQYRMHRNIMVSSMVLNPTPLEYFYPRFKGVPPWLRNICVHPSSLFLEQKSLFLDLLISFLKPFKTSDFSNHVSHVLVWWYYNWKHFQTYYNKVYYIQKLLCTSYIRLNIMSKSHHNQSIGKILYIHYFLAMFKYSNTDTWKHIQYETSTHSL